MNISQEVFFTITIWPEEKTDGGEEYHVFKRRLRKGCLCGLAWWGYYVSQQWSGGEWLTTTLPGLPPSTTWRVKFNNTENCRQPSSCLECPSAPSSLLHLTASFWSPPGLSLEISSSKVQFGTPCKLPGLLSSGLPEHFASCTAVACVQAGLHVGHDLPEGKDVSHVHCALSLALWPISSCSRGEQMHTSDLLLHGKPSTMTQ